MHIYWHRLDSNHLQSSKILLTKSLKSSKSERNFIQYEIKTTKKINNFLTHEQKPYSNGCNAGLGMDTGFTTGWANRGAIAGDFACPTIWGSSRCGDLGGITIFRGGSFVCATGRGGDGDLARPCTCCDFPKASHLDCNWACGCSGNNEFPLALEFTVAIKLTVKSSCLTTGAAATVPAASSLCSISQTCRNSLKKSLRVLNFKQRTQKKKLMGSISHSSKKKLGEENLWNFSFMLTKQILKKENQIFLSPRKKWRVLILSARIVKFFFQKRIQIGFLYAWRKNWIFIFLRKKFENGIGDIRERKYRSDGMWFEFWVLYDSLQIFWNFNFAEIGGPDER